MDCISEAVCLKQLSYGHDLLINGQFITFILALIAIAAFVSIFAVSKSKKHRELVSDLYVIGTIRNFAKEDGIDLNKEMKDMRKFQKLESTSLRNLDNVIEDELKEKVQAVTDKKLEKEEKKV